jgi:hypothetical protein
MNTSANFRVDPRLASLLGENYRSTELAIKELVDNAWDADAENVWVELPSPLTMDPIVIRDDGTGMTESEVRNEYLNIASSRVLRKGERTRLKNRQVKGRKGIGKFAGLMVASLMKISSRTRGQETQLQIWRDELIRAKYDLEQVNLPLESLAADPEAHGTEITLSGINQNFTFPNADKLKRLLVLEYGRMPDFTIWVDGEKVDIEDIPGDAFEEHIELSTGERAYLRFTISDGKRPLKQSGIAVRVGGKVVGPPRFFGLGENEEIPPRLLRRIFGEVVADSLEADVTADWGSIIDNSLILQELTRKLRPALTRAVQEIYYREVDLSKTRMRKCIDDGLDRLPDHRRAHAERAMDQVLRKFYGESESRISTVISLLLDAYEKSDYWLIMQEMEASLGADNEQQTKVFSEFGMLDLAMITQQTSHRLTLLRDLERLLFDPTVDLNQTKQILASNFWIFGNKYPLLSTHQELQQVIDLYVNHKYTNGHAGEAPYLLLLQDFNKGFLLLDLKKPDHTIDLYDRRKAKEFQADLKNYLPGRDIEVLVLGGAVSSSLVEPSVNGQMRFISYKGLIDRKSVV